MLTVNLLVSLVLVMDARKLELETGTVDVVIDKGTLDCLLVISKKN